MENHEKYKKQKALEEVVRRLILNVKEVTYSHTLKGGAS